MVFFLGQLLPAAVNEVPRNFQEGQVISSDRIFRSQFRPAMRDNVLRDLQEVRSIIPSPDRIFRLGQRFPVM